MVAHSSRQRYGEKMTPKQTLGEGVLYKLSNPFRSEKHAEICFNWFNRRTWLQLMTRGELARVDSTLEKLLGCLSTSFEQTVEKMLTNKEAGAKATPFYKTEVMKT
ncbi:unnamed protein product [Didymodactylos carnosus]|uniref:Uncharacterized protein n=1 Tax=Didymodactylos carnosus TaxID=1234261 RepID=A0A815YFQ4_9BILA|nr:unnamed protein product [Didymodactylos carnosus]CAF4433300.1 unnamed protein product [Didymodactylos carnosus]